MATVVKMGDGGGPGKPAPAGTNNRMALMIGGGILLLVIIGVVAVMMMNRPAGQAGAYDAGISAESGADTGEMPGEYGGDAAGGGAAGAGSGAMQDLGGAPMNAGGSVDPATIPPDDRDSGETAPPTQVPGN